MLKIKKYILSKEGEMLGHISSEGENAQAVIDDFRRAVSETASGDEPSE